MSTAPARDAHAAIVERIAGLFTRAAAAGRQALDPDEARRLTDILGLPGGSPVGPDEVAMSVSLEFSREFGMVLNAGLGGADAGLAAGNFRRDRASVHAAAELTNPDDFLQLFKRTLAWQRLDNRARLEGGTAPDAALRDCFETLLQLAAAPWTGQQPLAIEIDLACGGAALTVAAVRCTFAPPPPGRLPRPTEKIDKLLHPRTIGIIGVSSTSMNFGRIILKNLMGSGYPKEQLRIIRPGESEIDGVRCIAGLKALDEKLDLLIVAVAASAVYELVDEIIDTDAVEAVMLIPGSLGETRASREPAAALAARINAAHGKPGGGPIFLGANCLGVVSHPGSYDSWFIPLERLPKPQKKPERNSVMLSQSGAFMITRISQNPWLDPRYMLALGNQTDLTHGDLLGYFADQAGIATIGMYIEGFKDGDGLDFARAVRKAVKNGKDIVVYKSGKTTPGAGGVMGHTASIAGSPQLFDSVVRHAGAIVAEDFSAFDDLFYIAGALHDKTIGGRRLGAISGAGFEAVGMADATETDSFAMDMGTLEAATVTQVEGILKARKLDALVEVRNPIDINPGADDEAHLQIVEAFLGDPNIDAVVVGLDPTAPAVRALESSTLHPGFDIHDPKSSVHLMPPLVERNAKPIIGIIDGGQLYDAMSAGLMDRGVCIFRNCGRGTKALVRYVEARMYAASLRGGN